MMRVRFYSVDKTEDISLGHSLSDCSERLLPRRKGEPGHLRSFGSKDQVVGTSKVFFKENQISQGI